MNALQHQRPIVGIDIHTIPDEWGETRKKGGAFNTDGTFVGGKKAELLEDADHLAHNMIDWQLAPVAAVVGVVAVIAHHEQMIVCDYC